jgi:transposase
VFFKRWYSWASRCRLAPIKGVARMLKTHLDNLLTYFAHPITNATSEGFNSKIQSLKHAARGFRSFHNFRIRILFFCGRLNLYPTTH